MTTHRRSRVALGVLGVVLAFSIVPGVASANHGRPHADVYLGELERHFAIEYPGASAMRASSSALMADLQQHFAIEYPGHQGGLVGSAAILDGLQRHFAIEYPSYVWDGRLAG